jgi:hypothetical protein
MLTFSLLPIHPTKLAYLLILMFLQFIFSFGIGSFAVNIKVALKEIYR